MSGNGSPYPYVCSLDAQNVHHPLVGALLQRLNAGSIEAMLDPGFLGSTQPNGGYGNIDGTPPWIDPDTQSTILTGSSNAGSASGSIFVETTIPPLAIDVNPISPCGGYNWELLYHIPVMIAVHLTSTQRFAEAQRWFHLVFDPTATDGVYGGPSPSTARAPSPTSQRSCKRSNRRSAIPAARATCSRRPTKA